MRKYILNIKIFKRTIAFLLAIAMSIGMLPLINLQQVFASNEVTYFEAVGYDTGKFTNACIGMVYKINDMDYKTIDSVDENNQFFIPEKLNADDVIRFKASREADETSADEVKLLRGPMSIVTARGCSTEENNDGKIIGVDGFDEYKEENGSWKNCPENEITNLRPGKYYVRFAANSFYLASDTLEVIVKDYANRDNDNTNIDKVVSPIIGPPKHSFKDSTTITMFCENEDAKIYYTIDGTEPNSSCNEYTEKVEISETTTFKAIAIAEGMNDSDVVTSTYNKLVKAETPNATFNATGTNSGVLSNVEPGMMYYVESGLGVGYDFSKNIESSQILIPGRLTGERIIKIFRRGDNIITCNSDPQIITLNQPEAPYDAFEVPCTSIDSRDGKITDVNEGMEYCRYTGNTIFDSEGWIHCTGSEINNLDIGKYFLRIKASGTTLASTPATKTIKYGEYNEISNLNMVSYPKINASYDIFRENDLITISCETEDAKIYYTLDGTDPSETNGELYSSDGICVTETTTIKAIAIKEGMIDSRTASKTVTKGNEKDTPNAKYQTTGGSSVLLTNISTDMEYSIDNGNTYNRVVSEPMEVNYDFYGINIRKINSEFVQKIDIERLEMPNNIDFSHCTTSKNCDGKIYGLNTDMEYSCFTPLEWTPCEDTELKGLTPGYYYVRYKANGIKLASNYKSIYIRGKVDNPIINASKTSFRAGESVSVTLTCPLDGTDIYYTLNGKEPYTTEGIKYTSETINITETTTIKIRAYKEDMINSDTVTLTIKKGNPELDTPNAIFSATSNNSGTLSNVTTDMEYSIGIDTNYYNVTNTSINLEDLSPTCTIRVKYKEYDYIQSIFISQFSEPIGIDANDCITLKNNDGQINGVDESMQYKKDGSNDWLDCVGTKILDLEAGTYFIRIKPEGNKLASPSKTIVIHEYTEASIPEQKPDSGSGSTSSNDKPSVGPSVPDTKPSTPSDKSEETPVPSQSPTEEPSEKPDDKPNDVVISNPSLSKENEIILDENTKNVIENIINDKTVTAVSKETAEEIKEAVSLGKEIVTEVITEVTRKESIGKTVIETLETKTKKLSTKAKIAEYLNLEVQLKADDKVLGNINELSKPIDFTVKIPDSLKAANRKYFVLRVHNGVVEKLDTVVNADGTLSFKTDKFSTYALAYEDVTKPGTVKNLKVISGTKSIKLTWVKDKNATGYRVFIAKNGKWVKHADTKLNSYYSNNFAAGTNLKFAVKAYYKSDISLAWADKHTSINTCTKPSKVTGFTAKAVSRTAVATTWKKTNGATGYRVYVAKNGKWIQVATTKTNKYTFKGLKRNTKYKFAVRAYKTVGNKTVLADTYAYTNTRTKK